MARFWGAPIQNYWNEIAQDRGRCTRGRPREQNAAASSQLLDLARPTSVDRPSDAQVTTLPLLADDHAIRAGDNGRKSGQPGRPNPEL